MIPSLADPSDADRAGHPDLGGPAGATPRRPLPRPRPRRAQQQLPCANAERAGPSVQRQLRDGGVKDDFDGDMSFLASCRITSPQNLTMGFSGFVTLAFPHLSLHIYLSTESSLCFDL